MLMTVGEGIVEVKIAEFYQLLVDGRSIVEAWWLIWTMLDDKFVNAQGLVSTTLYHL